MNSRLFELVRKCWKLKPNQAFGEIINDITYEAAGHSDIGSVSDEDLIAAAERIVAGQRRAE